MLNAHLSAAAELAPTSDPVPGVTGQARQVDPFKRPALIRFHAVDGRARAYRRFGLLGADQEIGPGEAKVMLLEGEALELPPHPRRCWEALRTADLLLDRGFLADAASEAAAISHGLNAADTRHLRGAVTRMLEATADRRPAWGSPMGVAA